MRRQLSHPYHTLNLLEISKQAILANYDLIADHHPGMAVMPVLKANAYGHGINEIAEILTERRFPFLIVDGYFEALKLRQAYKQPILIMGYIDPINFSAMKTNGFSFVIHDHISLETLGRMRRSVNIHLEINTGMNRNGIDPSELDSFLTELGKYQNVHLEGVMSHLADADGESDETTDRQVELFDQCVDKILEANFNPKLVHIAQTAGSERKQSKHANAIRLGIGLYGINPFSDGPNQKNLSALEPALKLTSTISKVIPIKKGDRVSYNGIFTAEKPTRIGVLPLGYYEGIPRSLSNAGEVKWENSFMPIRGRVCMNHTMIDLGNSEARYGDQVTVISSDPKDINSVAELSRRHNLFSYELLVGLSESIRRVIRE
ncbi:MAG: alanine racemase [Candidatus Saccharimonadia bacterium]